MKRLIPALAGGVALACLSSADTITLNPTADARILQVYPTSASGSDILSTYDVGTNEQRTVLQFDVSAVPAEMLIQSAVLRLYGQSLGSPASTSILAYRVDTPWLENEATWNDAATGTPWTSAGGDLLGTGGAVLASPYGAWTGSQSTSPSWHELSVTGLIAEYYAGTYANNGIGLDSPEGSNLVFVQRESTASTRPQLVIEYMPVPEPASLLLLVIAAMSLRRGR